MNRLPASIAKHKSAAFSIFQAALDAVNPYRITSSALISHGKELSEAKRLYVCAFGKAAFDMMRAVDDRLSGDHNVCGMIASLPIGQKAKTADYQWKSRNIHVYYGAKNNVADHDSMKAANHIFALANALAHDDAMLVLISGGGSALLPLPADGISLRDKQKVTVCLSQKAATIQELNTVRKALSLIKGGGLLRAAHPAKVVSFILSDVIGDPVELIASGPSVPDSAHPGEAIEIIEKHDLGNCVFNGLSNLLNPLSLHRQLPLNIIDHLRKYAAEPEKEVLYGEKTFIVGSNAMALGAAAQKATELGYAAQILTDRLWGEARVRGSQFARFLHGDLQAFENLDLHTTTPTHERAKCYLMGGETTVNVRGWGKGGRNQEFALSAAIRFDEDQADDNVLVLSAGTDGIDGPTDAAGAYGYRKLVSELHYLVDSAQKHLQNNDSYPFLKQRNALLFTGHTGTNVMDIAIGLSNE